jgi:hypothetical protein
MLGGLGSIFSGIGSFLGGKAMAKGYKQAAASYREAARITKISGELKGLALDRQIYKLQGEGIAAAGAGNIALTGSAKDAIQSNLQQGYLSKAVNVLNTKLEYQSYMAQAAQAEASAKATKTGILGLIGGVLGAFSDDRLKENVKLVGRRGDGIGIYRFNYKDDNTVYEGVMASEVAMLRPEAVHEHGGYLRVDYGALGLKLKKAA